MVALLLSGVLLLCQKTAQSLSQEVSVELPVLESKFDQVLEQVFLLIRDIEKGKLDAGVTVMVVDGAVDVRGLGVVKEPVQAVALLFLALRSLPPQDQKQMGDALQELMERSMRIAKEAPLWSAPAGT